MARVKSCCCGCTLSTGTLIILWLVVVWDSLQIMSYFSSSSRSILASSSMGLRVLDLVVAIIALYAVFEKKPSFLVPYIAVSIFIIAIMVLTLFLLVVASTLVMNSGVFDQLIDKMQQSQSSYSVDQQGNQVHTTLTAEEGVQIAKAVTTAVTMTAFFVTSITLAISTYFTIVVYSFYKEMVEGTGNTGGVIYSAPVDQGVMGGGGYPQPQPGYPYPQSQPVYPPSYGQQPDGVYPPLSEMKQ